ncbi:MAG: hypothetical protein C4K60_16455 [Ideonella sp. MAG2]|nr:MAG: hypothetical protein C4K60_16455 [Ideonella sp. MAG2]
MQFVISLSANNAWRAHKLLQALVLAEVLADPLGCRAIFQPAGQEKRAKLLICLALWTLAEAREL